MKVKFKLLVFIFLLALVPIIIVNVFSSSRISGNSMELISAATAGIISNQADNVNLYFEEAVASAKNLASSENVRSYTKESNENNRQASVGV